ncbi:gliding motility protein GldM [Bacteroides sp. OttesenSCG-928-D19]|nr:gliding motility protein GldM [Bacteroides sp. OttesenSCG-928-D19]
MAISNLPDSPRQKMINLLYIVLMAMLALNISSDVLEGFSLVDDSMSRTTLNVTEQNRLLYEDFVNGMRANPEKVGPWFAKAKQVKDMSDSLYTYVDRLKLEIVRQADGKEADVNNIKNKEDLEAASYIMLSPTRGEGKALYNVINTYRSKILELVEDTLQKRIINDNLSTGVPNKALTMGKNWQEYMFENMPVAAAVTMLTKLQSDIRYAEGEVLHSLANYIDVSDLRVNQLNAYVIPNSQHVVRGNKFSGQVILAAVDSTQRPAIYIEGQPLSAESQGYFETTTTRTGDFSINGHLELDRGDGVILRRDFSQKYTVVEPSATVSATMMNVLYAGYDNPLSVSVPGVSANKVQASIANGNGTIRPDGSGYIVTPTKIGEDVVIRVTATIDGSTHVMGNYNYRVRQLPDPSPFIEYTDAKGVVQRYRGSTGFPKAALMNTDGIVAAIDDGLLNINFRVLSFETVFFDNMGNAVPEVSAGTNFSTRQKDMFRRLSRGKRFYISRVKAIGPDGVERLLPTTLEVIVN